MAGRKWEVSVATDASHSLSVECPVFVKETAYESVEQHRAKPRSHTPGLQPVENLPTLGI
jgi:hypothetical protein